MVIFAEPYTVRNYISTQQSFHDYLNSIKPSELYHESSGKIKNGNINDFTNFFYKSVLNWTPNEKYFMKMYIDKVDKYLRKYPLFSKYPWIVAKTDPKLLHGASFTLGRCIFISQRSVNNGISYYRKHNELKKYTLGTFIHEKIHILQRYNQQRFDHFYHLEFPFMKKVSSLPQNIYHHIYANNLTNPDGLDLRWVYIDSDNNQMYYPYVAFDQNETNSMYEKAIDTNMKLYNLGELNLLKDITKRLPKYKTNVLGVYHPNELIAHLLDKQIVDENVDLKYLDGLFK